MTEKERFLWTEQSIFRDFRSGRIDYDEMARRFRIIDADDWHGDLVVIWTVALAAIVIVLGVFAGT